MPLQGSAATLQCNQEVFVNRMKGLIIVVLTFPINFNDHVLKLLSQSCWLRWLMSQIITIVINWLFIFHWDFRNYRNKSNSETQKIFNLKSKIRMNKSSQTLDLIKVFLYKVAIYIEGSLSNIWQKTITSFWCHG